MFICVGTENWFVFFVELSQHNMGIKKNDEWDFNLELYNCESLINTKKKRKLFHDLKLITVHYEIFDLILYVL